jgi:hypothetical protein
MIVLKNIFRDHKTNQNLVFIKYKKLVGVQSIQEPEARK